MTAYRELIERLESATGPDRVLDHDILLSLSWTAPPVYHIDRAEGGTWKLDDDGPDTFQAFPPDRYSAFWREPSGKVAVDLPALTWSVDAAANFAKAQLPGLLWAAGSMEDGPFASFVVANRSGDYIDGGRHTLAATPAIAILLLALRALEAQSKDKEEGE